MKIKALTSFASPNLTMYKGEVRDCDNNAVIPELLAVHYVEKVAEKVAKPITKKVEKKAAAKKPRKKKNVGDEK